MPPIKMRGDGRKAKNPKKTFARLLGYLKPYTGHMIGMVICIVVTAVASVLSNRSLSTLIDKYITPMLKQDVPDFGPMLNFLGLMACIYLTGLIASYLQQRLMVPVGQGVQRTVRDRLFTHMQRLPIRYFDTHPAGDVMKVKMR